MNLCPHCQSRFTPPQGVFNLKEAIEKLLIAKQGANLRPAYLKSLKRYLASFCHGREEMPLAEIKVDHIEKWFHGRKESPTARKSNIGRLGSLFGFAFRRGWIFHNPILQLERVRIDHKPPMILKPEQVKDLLAAVNPNCLAYVILATFAGVRPDEILHLPWTDVDLDRGLLTVNHSKTRRRRLVRLEPNAIAWLKTCENKKGRVAPSAITIKRMRQRVRHLLPDWHQDLLRHTAASYLIALHKDASKVATSLGNSAPILMTHYHDMVAPEVCAEFWAILP